MNLNFYEQPRTFTLSAKAIAPILVRTVLPAKPGSNTRYRVYSQPPQSPSLILSADEATKYLTDNHNWDQPTAETILARLEPGDEMIPDEEWSGEERLVRFD